MAALEEDNAMKVPDLARLIFLAALWGGSFIFIRLAAPVLGPIVLVTIRVLLAGSALLVYAFIAEAISKFGLVGASTSSSVR